MNPRLTLAALYAGGFLGPFAGGITTAMLPELGRDFDVSPQVASYSLTAYLVPFAALMLFSGTLGARWGASRSVRVAYLVYVAASLLCAVAGDYPLFLAARAVQGGANAFTTPLLLAAIATITPPERLGRTLGLFASLQAAGQTSAPLLGGVAAEVNWRVAFVGVAVVSLALAMAGLPEQMRERQRTTATLRSAWRPSVLRAGWLALVGWACLGGMSVLLALRAEEVFNLSAASRGLVLTGFGVVGLLSARYVGRSIDRIGARRAVLIGSVVGAVPIALVGTLPWLPAVTVLWALTGITAQLVLVGVNALVLGGEGPNRAGAVSVVQSLRFTGAAVSPLAFTPLYQAEPALGFLIPAALVAVNAPLTLALHRPRKPDPAPEGP
ncbi:MFS transporter [Actinokineospora auranticolor]|uniref:Putative MFS family arabinose efflux permease n=1 Tax=Actinokineospora auranticolor TaxID=155976 RepID=A0A2S6H0K9_9PSEU|nr:MFS transporter [Actinokineospora auranticolor]PPK71015.1 putative MFS family arabinose efflux permease [Actinokineospora auranticolor]